MQNPTIFSLEQLSSLDAKKIPRHVAIIPDGNRRWAGKENKNKYCGHRAGAHIIIQTVKAAKEIGIQTLTFYLFSTENWSRPKREVAALMWLLKEFLTGQLGEMLLHGVRLRTIGDLTKLGSDVIKVVQETAEKTSHCQDIDMVLALNYGSRDEICRAVQNIVESAMNKDHNKDHNKDQNKGINKDQNKDQAAPKITEALIAAHLDTAAWGDPELLIRTSGEMRVSNFLLWQLSYTELHVTPVFWPDFKPINLFEAVVDFQKRQRRLGGA